MPSTRQLDFKQSLSEESESSRVTDRSSTDFRIPRTSPLRRPLSMPPGEMSSILELSGENLDFDIHNDDNTEPESSSDKENHVADEVLRGNRIDTVGEGPPRNAVTVRRNGGQNMYPFPLRKQPKRFVPGEDDKDKFAKVSAHAKGFLTRLLMKTDKVQGLMQTIKDTKDVLADISSEDTQSVQEKMFKENVEGHLRVARGGLHDVFFKVPVQERMSYIAHSRAIARAKEAKQRVARSSVEIKPKPEAREDRKKKTWNIRVLRPQQGHTSPPLPADKTRSKKQTTRPATAPDKPLNSRLHKGDAINRPKTTENARANPERPSRLSLGGGSQPAKRPGRQSLGGVVAKQPRVTAQPRAQKRAVWADDACNVVLFVPKFILCLLQWGEYGSLCWNLDPEITIKKPLHEADVSSRLLKELSALGKRLGLLHNDLLSSPVAKNVDRRHSAKREDGSAGRDPFIKKLSAELVNLRSLLMAKSNIGLNGVLLTDNREVRTRGMASNSLNGNTTSLPPDDLVHLSGPITEDAVIGVLQQRSTAGENYTNLGPVLIAVNSFAEAQSKTGLLQSIADNQRLQSIVQTVTRKLAISSAPQVIVLSGNGGSGKTFTAQALVQHLLEQAGGGLDSDICKHFLASVAVIQSLGNAKTTTNSDSSRMGNLFEFHLSDGLVSRTKIQCHLLDSTRVASPPVKERNYHIFYQLLYGITQEERVKLHLQGYSVHSLSYLSGSPIPYNEDEEEFRAKFERWRGALATLGIPFVDVLRILVAILLLGNIEFVDGEGLELDVKGNNEIKAVAALLGVSGVSLYRGLTTKTKNVRGQILRSLCDSITANTNRDALAKALYCRTVAAIVRRVNSYKRPASMLSMSPQGSYESLRAASASSISTGSLGKSPLNTSNGLLMASLPVNTPPSTPGLDGSFQLTRGASGLIGIMDMFGFENSQVNQMEQLCVNLCSETLQHFYNTHIFKSREEYSREEGVLSDLGVDYFDNAPCIELLTCQRAGVLTVLDKESLFARGSYQNFLQKVKGQHKDSECFFDPDSESSCFGVSHFNGNVVYDASSLININRDSITDDIICVFSRQNCNFGFATHLFTNDLKPQQGQTTAPKGVLHRISPTPTLEVQSPAGAVDAPLRTFSQGFQEKLDGLLKTLVQAQPTFVRCIKINTREEPYVFDRGIVSQQIRVLQIFETLQLLQSGLAHRTRLQAFARKYSFVSPRKVRVQEETGYEDCKAILETLMRKIDRSKNDVMFGSWVLGKRHVFYSEVVKQELEILYEVRKVKAAVTIQCWLRRWICRKRWPNLKRSLELQKKARHGNKVNHNHVRRSVSPSDELRVDTKAADQSCCLYGVDMETPPPLPKSRPYTVMGNMKMGFPQTRIMKYDFPDDGSEVLLKKGEAVKVIRASEKRGYLVIEHKNTIVHLPFQVMELKNSPNPSPR
ncbi:Myosin [Desmophyllum pertusum]|uniref:Myosin n=1 Tax=Desmophyllum pertusum TaxID=174260 RepID=A0A9W9ZB98_9CNID|nr:Myosin [Desmophyllum pertusum]